MAPQSRQPMERSSRRVARRCPLVESRLPQAAAALPPRHRPLRQPGRARHPTCPPMPREACDASASLDPPTWQKVACAQPTSRRRRGSPPPKPLPSVSSGEPTSVSRLHHHPPTSRCCCSAHRVKARRRRATHPASRCGSASRRSPSLSADESGTPLARREACFTARTTNRKALRMLRVYDMIILSTD